MSESKNPGDVDAKGKAVPLGSTQNGRGHVRRLRGGAFLIPLSGSLKRQPIDQAWRGAVGFCIELVTPVSLCGDRRLSGRPS